MRKVDAARQAFESMKSQGLQITKSLIAKLAGVSRTLLSPRTDGSYKSKEWEQLANDIATYQASDKPTKTRQRYRNKMQELRNARDEFERKYQAQVEQTAELYGEMVDLRNESSTFKSAYELIVKENNRLQNLYNSLSVQYSQPLAADQWKVTPIPTSITISTDDELLSISGGQYRWDSLIARQAHTYSRKKLKTALARLVPKRLYLLIGRPGSGKSSWIKKHLVSNDGRLAIYYDAINATVADRWEIMELAKESSNVVVCYVYFDVDVRMCIANSRKRKEKIIPEDKIRDCSIDPPLISEGFDELIVIRSR